MMDANIAAYIDMLEQYLDHETKDLTPQQVLSYLKVCAHQGVKPIVISKEFLGTALMVTFPHILIGIEKDGYAHS